MTAPPGHIGIGLLLAAPVWLLLSGDDVLTFVRYVGLAAMLPDLDVYVPGVPHHGITHTLFFVAVVAALGGLAAVASARFTARRWMARTAQPSGRIYAIAAGGLLLGGASHVFLDLFSSSYEGFPMAVFWPLVDRTFAFDLVYYTDPVVNYGLVGTALAVHALAAYSRVGTAPRRLPWLPSSRRQESRSPGTDDLVADGGGSRERVDGRDQVEQRR